MKIYMLLFLMIYGGMLSAQNNQLPDVKLKDIEGSSLTTSTFSSNDSPLVFVFWSTTCHHTINGLDEISDLLPDWEEELNFKIIIISTDDTRSSGKVPGFVNGKGWDFECYIDENGDFRRALNINNAPHILIYDKNYNIIFNQSTFNIGDEEVIYNHLKNAQ